LIVVLVGIALASVFFFVFSSFSSGRKGSHHLERQRPLGQVSFCFVKRHTLNERRERATTTRTCSSPSLLSSIFDLVSPPFAFRGLQQPPTPFSHLLLALKRLPPSPSSSPKFSSIPSRCPFLPSYASRRPSNPRTMKLKELEAELQPLRGFETPKRELEQYVTSAHLASRMLFTAATQFDDIDEKEVLDLGCGCAVLSIASVMMGAE
jgi:hypothetical protein